MMKRAAARLAEKLAADYIYDLSIRPSTKTASGQIHLFAQHVPHIQHLHQHHDHNRQR